MAIQQRTLGYARGIQRLVWDQGDNIPVTAYLWGGGGGGGGSDSQLGATGQGGGSTEVNFLVSTGDTIVVAVGGGGGAGQSRLPQAGGGSAGSSGISSVIFDTRSAAASPPVIASTNSAYVGFLNTYGVWVNPVSARNFDRSYVVNFPTTGLYTFTGSADNSAEVYIDDVFIGAIPGFRGTWAYTINVTAGTATVRIIGVNTGGPGSVALTIDYGDSSYSGGAGGQAGPAGSSGGGGGGGGATVIYKNGIPLAVAGGGGGGGGGGNFSPGAPAPGTTGQASVGTTAGQNGQNHPSDGGGAGGGGGGLGGGNGGVINFGDLGGGAGTGGLSSSPASDPSGRQPGGRSNSYYPGTAGLGGTSGGGGGPGAAVVLFDVPGLFVHNDISFTPVRDSWIKLNNEWAPVQITYVKDNGVWQPLVGSTAPLFDVIDTGFGRAPRVATVPQAPYTPPVFNTGSGSWEGADAGISADSCGGGDGGCKIICTAMNQAYGFGSFRNAIWIAYADKHLTKAHEVGYHTIFFPLVDFGFKRSNGKLNIAVRRVMEWGTRHRSIDLRAEMRGTKRDTVGRIIRMIFEPLCYAVGKLKGY